MENRYKNKKLPSKWWLYALLIFVVLQILMAMYYDQEPDFFDVNKNAAQRAQLDQQEMVTGFTSSATFLEVTDVLLNKPGGYMSNDVMPPLF